METYHVFEHNCNHFSDACADFLLGEGIPKDITGQPNEFLSTPLGQMIAPMMQQAQDGLKVQSNTLFNEQGGTNDLRNQPPPGIMGGQGAGGAGGAMPPFGGMGGAGGMPPMGGAGGMPPMGGAGGMPPGGAGGAGGMPPGMPPGGIPPHLQQMMQGMNP